MRKVKTHKGFVIAVNPAGTEYQVFTKEEWDYGEGLRSPEYDGLGSMEEALDNVDPHRKQLKLSNLTNTQKHCIHKAIKERIKELERQLAEWNGIPDEKIYVEKIILALRLAREELPIQKELLKLYVP